MINEWGRKVFLCVFWVDLSRLLKDLIEVMSQICLPLNNFRLGIHWEKITEKHQFIGAVLGLSATAGQI